MKVVNAQFNSVASDYHYFVQPGDDPQPGDFIITSYDEVLDAPERTKFDARGPRFAVVKNTFSPLLPNKAKKPYLLLIPLSILETRRNERLQLMHHAKIQADAKAALQKMLQERSEVEMFKQLAAENPEAARLYAILQTPIYHFIEAPAAASEPEMPSHMPAQPPESYDS